MPALPAAQRALLLADASGCYSPPLLAVIAAAHRRLAVAMLLPERAAPPPEPEKMKEDVVFNIFKISIQYFRNTGSTFFNC